MNTRMDETLYVKDEKYDHTSIAVRTSGFAYVRNNTTFHMD